MRVPVSVPLWVSETAAAFWEAAGEREPFPRTLIAPIARALPLTVVQLAGLHVATVERWLRAQAVGGAFTVRDRPLRACLVARRGHGIIFLDGTDTPDERRFSLAHELAHFLLDYWLPRGQATRRVGPDALAVLDGDRPAQNAERIHAALARVPLEAHVHLLDRNAAGAITTPAIAAAEQRADRLAYELLAPGDGVSTLLQTTTDPAAITHLLREQFGLPPDAAATYTAILTPPAASPPPLLRRLGFG